SCPEDHQDPNEPPYRAVAEPPGTARLPTRLRPGTVAGRRARLPHRPGTPARAPRPPTRSGPRHDAVARGGRHRARPADAPSWHVEGARRGWRGARRGATGPGRSTATRPSGDARRSPIGPGPAWPRP